MKAALLVRLAWASVRGRPGGVALTAVVVLAAALTLSVAAGAGRSIERPWERTFAATRGAHVSIQAGPGAAAAVERLSRDQRVEATAGPHPFKIVAGGSPTEPDTLVRLLGQDAPAAVDRGLVVAGRWPRAGEVALERSFARGLDLEVGDVLAAGGREWRVSGLALSASQGRYPQHVPGLAWAPVADVVSLEVQAPAAPPTGGPTPASEGIAFSLRLRESAGAEQFAIQAGVAVQAMARPWTEARADAAADAPPLGVVFGTFGLVALVAAAAVVGVAVTARVLDARSDLGTLRALGLTPAQGRALLVIEQLLVALPAALVGLVGGAVVAPQLIAPSAALLAAPGTPAIDLGAWLAILVGLVAVTAVATTVASRRIVGRPTIEALTGATAPATRRPALPVISGLAVPIALALRELTARPARAALATSALALAAAMGVASLAMEATFALDTGVGAEESAAALRPVVYPMELLLLALGLVTLLATALLGVRERRRETGMLATLGLTPGELARSTTAQAVLVGTAAGAIGAPLGLAIFDLSYRVAEASADHALPPLWQLLLVVPATALLATTAGATAARVAAATAPATALRAD